MRLQQAQELIKATFENPFDKDRFAGFIKNLLNQVEEKTFTYQGNYIPDAYKPTFHRWIVFTNIQMENMRLIYLLFN
jgi:hypothetical protein